MNSYVILPIMSMSINLSLGIYLLYKNWKSSLNRILALIFFAFVFWVLGALGMRVASSAEQARFWLNFSGFGWLFIGSLFLHFILIYSKKKKISEKKLTYFFLYTPPTIFLYLLWKTNLIFQEMGRFRWVYYDIPAKGFFWVVAYLGIYLFLALYLCWQVYKKSTRMQKKRQAKCIFIGSILAIIGTTISEVVLPIVGISVIEMGTTFTFIPTVAIVYAIQKYELMSITPQLAAEKIIASMRDSLVVVNPDGTIALTNKATGELLGYEKEEMIGRPLEILFAEGKSRLENLSRTQNIKEFRTKCLTKDKRAIPVSLSTSEIRDKYGDFMGTLIVARDMREIDNLVVQLEKARNNLGKKVQEKTRELEDSRNELMLKLEELERWRKVTVGREEKILELKEEVEQLKEKLKAKSVEEAS